MPNAGADDKPMERPLLAADEPAPFTVRNPGSTVPLLLVCDHASRRFPRALGTLGLDPLARRCHLAIDIGAGDLTRALAASTGATAVLCGYSRLVVDCNRELMDPGAFLEYGDGIVVPGNRNLHSGQKALRADAIYRPYHGAIEAELARLAGAGVVPLFLSIHSFTPVLNGAARSWEMGVLWDRDPRTAECFTRELRDAGYLVGDNEPYSGKAPQDYTIDHHAEPAGIPHVGLEIRQDLIHQPDGVERVAAVLHRVVTAVRARLRPTELATRGTR